jgi:type II secretory pathway component GspD/PulD (secretin)
LKKRSKHQPQRVTPLIAMAVAANSVHAQDAAPQPPATPAASPQAAAQQAPAPRIRFNFKGQTYDQILDYFSRTTGYPIVRETEVPKGTVDYIYPKDYTLDEALQTLNILLQTQSCMLRVEGGRMFLQKLDEMKRENVPTFVGTLPSCCRF